MNTGDAGRTAAQGEHSQPSFPRNDRSDVEVVNFPPGDSANPRNWPLWRKWSIIAVIFLVDISVSFAASGFSPATKSFAEDFDVSTEVATLGLSLFILGLAIGPMTLAPLSEVGERCVSRPKKPSTLT